MDAAGESLILGEQVSMYHKIRFNNYTVKTKTAFNQLTQITTKLQK